MQHALLADVGLPIVFVQWPLMLCALVPVIAVEAEAMRRRLGLPYRKALAGASKANVLSTLAGVPLAWLIMLAVEFVIVFPGTVAAQKANWPVDSPVFYIFYVLGIAWIGPPASSLWRRNENGVEP